ncbi:MAG: hypothetical protein E6J90_24455 [Deltaproteobacteria bacterium]|nr:MAG: hypothetical protein E6J90_24455 [Deltaproteobacteria bacterium]
MRLLAITAAVTAACRLDPLVPDKPGASAHVLPAGTAIPDAASNPDLVAQLTLHDGIDTGNPKALMLNVIQRGTGPSHGAAVRFWSFGTATRAPSPLYIFGTGDVAARQFQELPPGNPQLRLAAAVPGDYTYSPLHTVYDVVVTPAYKGELITTTTALADAIDLGLVEPPVPIGSFIDSPIVRPGLVLDIGPNGPVAPTKLFGHGHVVDSFALGGEQAFQPDPNGLLPTSQVSYLREQGSGGDYDASRPIFQATLPSPGVSYTPLSVVVNVDLTVDPNTIKSDIALFIRTPLVTGSIHMTTSDVALYTVTTTSKVLQLQLVDGQP